MRYGTGGPPTVILIPFSGALFLLASNIFLFRSVFIAGFLTVAFSVTESDVV